MRSVMSSYFPQHGGCLSTLSIVLLEAQEFNDFDKVQFHLFFFGFLCFCVSPKRPLPSPGSWPVFFPKSFMVLVLTFWSGIHFEFTLHTE